MSTDATQQHLVGQIVNGHILGADGAWHSVGQAIPAEQITPAALSEIILPSKKKSFGKRLLVGLVVGLVLIVGGTLVAGAISGGGKSAGTTPTSTTPVGLNDPAKLAESVKASYQAAVTKGAPGALITNVACVPQAIAHQFQCVVTVTADGQEQTASHTVTVTAAGDNWVAASEGN